MAPSKYFPFQPKPLRFPPGSKILKTKLTTKKPSQQSNIQIDSSAAVGVFLASLLAFMEELEHNQIDCVTRLAIQQSLKEEESRQEEEKLKKIASAIVKDDRPLCYTFIKY